MQVTWSTQWRQFSAANMVIYRCSDLNNNIKKRSMLPYVFNCDMFWLSWFVNMATLCDLRTNALTGMNSISPDTTLHTYKWYVPSMRRHLKICHTRMHILHTASTCWNAHCMSIGQVHYAIICNNSCCDTAGKVCQKIQKQQFWYQHEVWFTLNRF